MEYIVESQETIQKTLFNPETKWQAFKRIFTGKKYQKLYHFVIDCKIKHPFDEDDIRIGSMTIDGLKILSINDNYHVIVATLNPSSIVPLVPELDIVYMPYSEKSKIK